MSIEDITKYLKKKKGERFSADQLSLFVGLGQKSVYSNLRKLRKRNGNYHWEWCYYNTTRPMRVYWYEKVN